MSPSPRRCGISGSGVDSTELGRNRLGERNRAGRSRAPQLSAGTAGPAPAAPPPPERLPATARGAAAAAEARPGCTLGEGTNGYGRSFLRARARPPSSPAPRRPFLSPPGPGLREEGAGGGRRRRRAEEEKESKERSVPGEKPAPAAAASPLPPSRPVNAEMAAAAAKGSAGSPAPLGAPTPPATSKRKQPRRSGCWVNRRPQPRSRTGGWPRPLSTRRDGGGASGAQSQCAVHRARPAPAFLRPGGEKTSDGFCELAGNLGGGEALRGLQAPAAPVLQGLSFLPTAFSLPRFPVLEDPGLACLGRQLGEEL